MAETVLIFSYVQQLSFEEAKIRKRKCGLGSRLLSFEKEM
jgi:hypothetical protein